jgi:acetyltransferase
MSTSDSVVLHLPQGAKVRIRAIRPDDGPGLQRFVRRLSARSRYLRFFSAIKALSPGQLQRFLRSESGREMALVAESVAAEGSSIVAEARCVVEDGTGSAEFALAVADEFQRQGLGTKLMAALVAFASRAGVQRLFGEIKSENAAMLAFARKLGFQLRLNLADGTTVIASTVPAER